MNQDPFSIEDRIPCSDELCVGVINENGTCGVCHKPYEGTEPLPTKPSDGSPDPTVNSAWPAPERPRDGDSVDSDPEERICCVDEMCVGIIGPSGECGMCGKRP